MIFVSRYWDRFKRDVLATKANHSEHVIRMTVKVRGVRARIVRCLYLSRNGLRNTLLIWMINGSVLSIASYQAYHAFKVNRADLDASAYAAQRGGFTPRELVYSLIVPTKKYDFDISTFNICTQSEQYSFVHIMGEVAAREFPIASNDSQDMEGAVRHRLVEFAIQGGVSESVKKAGLTSDEVRAIERIAGWHFNLATLKDGDRISMLVRETGNDAPVDVSRLISALNITYNGQHLSIIGYRDEKEGWSYYTANGQPYRESVFSRIPLKREYRISSSFAPNRVHPITRKVTAHRGTDFATPIGTEVVVPADGVVVRGGRNHLNGNYIMIDHPGGYRTVYLHLHRIHPQLKIGMRVKKGDVVAHTGNTGRSTGPHLHYEVHDRGNPIDPMRIRLPNDNPLAESDLAHFRLHAQQMIASLVPGEEGEFLARWP